VRLVREPPVCFNGNVATERGRGIAKKKKGPLAKIKSCEQPKKPAEGKLDQQANSAAQENISVSQGVRRDSKNLAEENTS